MSNVRVVKANDHASLREHSERVAPLLCRTRGGSSESGCKLPMAQGMDIHACPKFTPL